MIELHSEIAFLAKRIDTHTIDTLTHAVDIHRYKAFILIQYPYHIQRDTYTTHMRRCTKYMVQLLKKKHCVYGNGILYEDLMHAPYIRQSTVHLVITYCLLLLFHRPLRTSTLNKEEPLRSFWSMLIRCSHTSSLLRCSSNGWLMASRSTLPTPGAGWTSSLLM